MPSDRFRAAVEALADEWETNEDPCADVVVRDLRAILAEHPATSAEGGHPNHGAGDHDCAPFTATPAEPDAGGEGLTDAEWREFQSIPEQGYSHRAWVDAMIADRERRAEARGAERALRDLADDIEITGYSWSSVIEAMRFKRRLIARADRIAGEGR